MYLFHSLEITSLDDVLAIGGYNPINKKVEMLNTERQTWQELADYPFVKG